MHAQDTAAAIAADLNSYWHEASYDHANNLVLAQLPNGEHAWLKPSTEPAEDDDALYWPTQAGRALCARWRAERWLFGREVTG